MKNGVYYIAPYKYIIYYGLVTNSGTMSSLKITQRIPDFLFFKRTKNNRF